MKKTIPITLSGILFHVEEDAYTRLSGYIDSIKTHFATYEDSAEIIADIENRISEQFSENGNKDKIVTLSNVEKLIASMGDVEDFSDGENLKENTKTSSDTKQQHKHKKLFRNPDDIIVAGVASGIAAYLGIDPIIVRLIFVAIVLLGGSGILIYVILWFIMPMAKTSTDKLQMRGEAITLESVNEIVREKVNEVKGKKGWFRKIISLPFLIIGVVARAILPIIRKIIGFILSLGSSAAIFGLIFALTIVLFNADSPYVDAPFLHMGHTLAVYIALFSAFFVALVPLLFILSLGVKIMSKKSMFTGTAVMSVIGLWCLALITLGVVSTRIVPEYKHFIETDPMYSQTTEDFPLSNFNSVSLKNDSNVTITEGPVFKVKAVGRVQNITDMSLSVTDNVLTVEQKKHFKLFTFFGGESPEVSITMPKVSTISAANGSRVVAIATSTDSISVKLSNGSSARLSLQAKNLDIEESNASYITLSGSSASTHIKLSNASVLKAGEMLIQNATVVAENGTLGDINVAKTLNVDLSNSSLIIYTGNPTIIKKTSNGSRLQNSNPETEKDTEGNF